MLVLEEEQGPPAPGAMERTLLDHAWNSSVAVDAVVSALVLAALSGPG